MRKNSRTDFIGRRVSGYQLSSVEGANLTWRARLLPMVQDLVRLELRQCNVCIRDAPDEALRVVLCLTLINITLLRLTLVSLGLCGKDPRKPAITVKFLFMITPPAQ